MADERELYEKPAAEDADAKVQQSKPPKERNVAEDHDSIGGFIARHLRTLKGLSKR